MFQLGSILRLVTSMSPGCDRSEAVGHGPYSPPHVNIRSWPLTLDKTQNVWFGPGVGSPRDFCKDRTFYLLAAQVGLARVFILESPENMCLLSHDFLGTWYLHSEGPHACFNGPALVSWNFS